MPPPPVVVPAASPRTRSSINIGAMRTYKFSAAVFARVEIAWCLSRCLDPKQHRAPTSAGKLGEMFSPVNAAFSGLAFAAVAITLLLQRDRLSLRREETIAPRTAHERAAASQRAAAFTRVHRKAHDAPHRPTQVLGTNSRRERCVPESPRDTIRTTEIDIARPLRPGNSGGNMNYPDAFAAHAALS